MKNAKYLLTIAALAALVFVGFSAFITEPNNLKPPVASTEDLATREANRNEFPFMVDIKVGGTAGGCGILISPEWVLTSAALLQGSSAADLTFGIHNTNDFGNASEPAAVRVHVTANDITLHPSWNANNLDNNVALIRLPSPLATSAAIQPINTIDGTQNWVGQAAQGVGWGMYLINNVLKYSTTPQVVDVAMIAMQQANTTLGKSYHLSNHVAATGQTYTTTVLVTTAGGAKLIGFLNEGQIGGGTAVYSRFDHFSTWIEQNSGVFFN